MKLSIIFNRIGKRLQNIFPQEANSAFLIAALAWLPFNPEVSLVVLAIPTVCSGSGTLLRKASEKLTIR